MSSRTVITELTATVPDDARPMYLRDLVRSLGRRWYILVTGLLITAAGCYGIYQVVPVSYDEQASMALLPPETTTEPVGNPFLLLGGLSQALDILTRTINSDAESGPLLDAHPDASFTVGADTSTSGPILLITATAPTEREARAMTSAVVSALPGTLQSLQSDLAVRPKAQIRIITVAVDEEATLNAKTRIQAVAAVAGAGVLAAILLTGLVDGLFRSRGTRAERTRRKK